MDMRDTGQSPLWRSTAGLVALGFGAVAAFFLFTEHRAHLYGLLPYVFLLACPLMMLFMHHGHHGHEDHDHSPGESKPPGTGGRTQR
jgi:peptidoglycan/LPS O-acetylase OafA/YrhL